MKSNKKPRHQLISQNRQPIISSPLGKAKFSWGIRNDYLDWEHKKFGFGVNCIHSFFRKIKPALDQYTSMTWADIQNRKSCHPMESEKIIKEMITRLQTLFPQDPPDTLYQIDIPGQNQKYRIWGRKEGNVFYLIWNDPNHEIYPVEKKRT